MYKRLSGLREAHLCYATEEQEEHLPERRGRLVDSVSPAALWRATHIQIDSRASSRLRMQRSTAKFTPTRLSTVMQALAYAAS